MYLYLLIAQIVVELQNKLPRARVVYCSATAVSEPKNLGFMSRLALWGENTEHKSFNQFLDSIETLGTGAIELNAMHLKSLGALQARQLSYSTCDFELVDVVSSVEFASVYEQAAKIFVDLYSELVRSGAKKTEYWAGKLANWKAELIYVFPRLISLHTSSHVYQSTYASSNS
jgi:hypothetical protein